MKNLTQKQALKNMRECLAKLTLPQLKSTLLTLNPHKIDNKPGTDELLAFKMALNELGRRLTIKDYSTFYFAMENRQASLKKKLKFRSPA